jgi:hypothetical protein
MWQRGRAFACSKMYAVRTKNPSHGSPEREQKLAALSYLHEAWAEARLDGVDEDCMAQACLFAALAQLVSTYGEEATAKFTDGLSERIRNGEFSVEQARQ